MYYELTFSYDMDKAFDPDGERVDIDFDDKHECIKDFTNRLAKYLKNFDLSDVDFDDDTLYIRFFTDTKLDNVNVNSIIFGSPDGNYVATTTKEVPYGSIHDYSYYEEPYYDTADVEIVMTITDAYIEKAEEFETESLSENTDKEDCGDVQKGTEMFNSAMGEDLENTELNETGYWANRPVRYKVYYNIHDNEVLEGGSNDVREAEKFAKDCIDRLASNPWEDKQDVIDAIDSVKVYDHLQEEDVTSSYIEKYSDIAVRNLLDK